MTKKSLPPGSARVLDSLRTAARQLAASPTMDLAVARVARRLQWLESNLAKCQAQEGN